VIEKGTGPTGTYALDAVIAVRLGLVALRSRAWDLGDDSCAAAARAVDRQVAVERADAIGEASEPCAAVRRGAALSVVADLDARVAVLAIDGDPGLARLRLLRDVRERLRDDEVRGGLDMAG
jgi:hypothetical protein